MTKAIEGKTPDHKWGKRARTLMRLVAGGAIEERELSKAVRTAEYSKHYAKSPRGRILYPLLRKHALLALPYLVSKGMSHVAALKLWAKAMGESWQNALAVAGLEQLGITEELYAAGVTKQTVAEKIAALMDAEYRKAFKDGSEVAVPDNVTQIRATGMAAQLMDVIPAKKATLSIRGKIDHAHLHGHVDLTKFQEFEKGFDPAAGIKHFIDSEAVEVSEVEAGEVERAKLAP